MCGLNGIFAYNSSASSPKHAELIATRDFMRARGPDGFGEWWSEDRRLGLGHRRLSIIDLSDRALQPMASEDGLYRVVFNGEIYNLPDIRRELEGQGVRFRTTSDTEALLHLYARDGAAMVHRLRGMFAFAIWDDQRRGLFLARDPYGIKPLYVANDGATFRFASQVKALLAGGQISRDPEPAGIVGFHLWGSVPEPFTLYREIRSLPAGHTQWIDSAGPRSPVSYLSIAMVLTEGSRLPCRADEVGPRVRDGVLSSVRAHLLADVEVGLFLSAGVDSGALLGLLRDAGQQTVRCVTLCFDALRGTSEDEVSLAKDVARHYGAEHVVRRVSLKEFGSELPKILEAMDQPSIDGINTWFVAKAASEVGLKVAMSGVGGDELFAGYPSFRQIPLWVNALRIPCAVPGLGRAAQRIGSMLGTFRRVPKALGVLEYGGTYAGAYFLRRGVFLPFELKNCLDPDLLEIGLDALQLLSRIQEQALTPCPRSPTARVVSLESTLYLRHQLLRDTDWAGMAHGLEIRTPLVDHELLKCLAPVVPRFRRGGGKSALAQSPSKPLLKATVNRAKVGFGTPFPSLQKISNSSFEPISKGESSRSWALEVLLRELGPGNLDRSISGVSA